MMLVTEAMGILVKPISLSKGRVYRQRDMKTVRENTIDMGDKDQTTSIQIISINLTENISGLKNRTMYINYTDLLPSGAEGDSL